MNTQADFWYLERVNLSQVFCEMANPTVKGHAEPKVYKRGEFVYFPNDTSNKVYYIEQGRVKIGAYSDEGKEIIKTVLQKGEVFGELAVVGEKKRAEFAQAMEQVMVCVMSVNSVKELMQSSQNFSLQITQIIGNKLIRTQRRLESLVFKDARSRIIEFLRDLAIEKGQRVGYEMLVRKFFTHQEIANLTGTSRQTVTTILNELREDNYIYFDRKKLLVRDVKQLEGLLEKL